MHRHDESTDALTRAVVRYAVERVSMDPPPLDAPRSEADLAAAVGPTITAGGLGGPAALGVFRDVLAPACISVDHPRHLSFVPAAPTPSSVLFDLVVGASSIYGGSWMEGAGAVHAENETLAWLAGLAGLPDSAGGVFVSGGTAGNLSALIAARWRWRARAAGAADAVRPLVLASSGTHSSINLATRAMDADLLAVADDGDGRMRRAALRDTLAALDGEQRSRVIAVVATAGTTNAGRIDELDAAADVAEELGSWLHVDAAYGGAALCAPSVRERFAGIERADSLIVDPHKWLFAPYDCCALVYRDPAVARAAHTQHAEYLEYVHAAAGDGPLEWNPSDYAHHLSRRARGLPLWFSLAVHGTDAYAEAVETTLATAATGADLVRSAPHLELAAEPELTVILFRRRGWDAERYARWSREMLASGTAFVVPTRWQDETVLRMCLVNPVTTVEDLRIVVDSLT